MVRILSSSFSISSLLVQMVLLLLHATQSASSSTTDMIEVLASVDHGTSKRVVLPRIGTLKYPYKQETYEVSNRRFLGRKIVFKQYGGQSSMSTTSTPSDSAISVRNSINVNVQPQRMVRNIRSGRPHTHRRVKVKIPGNFIPLNADYHVPRPHPPKNN